MTAPGLAKNDGRMTRDILLAILKDLPDVQLKDDAFTVDDSQIVSFHLSESSRNASVRDVAQGGLAETFVWFSTREGEQTYYLPYSEVSGISRKPGGKQGRAGFA